MKEELTLFPKNKLKLLILPLLLDQLFNVLVGMADTIMVSIVGEAAVSGVSLVDTLNMFFLMIFSGLATDGAIICAQLIEVKKYKKANRAGKILVLGLISSLGTIAIATNAVANSVLTFQALTEDAMGISLFSMWVFRIALSWILVTRHGYGIWAIYISFGVDWLFRTGAFLWKSFSKSA